jgi:hypothetical protein
LLSVLLPIAALAATAPVWAEAKVTPHAVPLGTETTIPLLYPERLRDFEPDGDRAVFVQDMRFRWYHLDLNRPCRSLRFIDTIGVRSRFTYALDRNDDVVADGERCTIARIVASGPPVRDADRKRRRQAAKEG